MSGKRAALFLGNPKAGGYERVGAAVKRYLTGMFELEWAEPESCDDGLVILSQFAETHNGGNGLGGGSGGLVLVAGGDGTLSRYLAGISQHGLPLAIVPVGTGNDFARSLGLPKDPIAACEIAVASHVRRVDMGHVSIDTDRTQLFLNAVTIGFGAHVTRLQSAHRKEQLGRWSYLISVAETLTVATSFEASLRLKSRGLQHHWSGEVRHISVASGRYQGGGLPTSPGAAVDDGQLHLSIITSSSLPDILQSLPHIVTGTHEHGRALVTFSVDEVDVCVDDDIGLSADGELLGAGNARFRIIPRALAVCVPPPM